MRVQRLAVALCAALIPMTHAVAQDAAPDGPRTTTELDTIVVKGEKTDRDLQDTTTSVAVTTEVRMEQENLSSVYQLFDRTANLSRTYGDAGFTIRGINNNDGEGAPLSTIYLDGAAMSHFMVATGPSTMWDLSQVEILRGPQSTIQGENALAGAIVLRTQDPDLESWGGRARVLLSDPSDQRVSFAAGGPLVEGELGVRLAAERRNFDGFVDNPTRGTGEDALDSTLVRGKILWTPSALPGLTARLSFNHFDRTGPYSFTYSSLDVPDYFDNRVNYSDAPNVDDTRTDSATLEVDYDIDGRWVLHAVTAWSDADSRRHYDNDYTAMAGSEGGAQLDSKALSQEFRIAYNGERLRGLVGLYYSKRDTHNATASMTGVVTPESTIAFLLQSIGLDPATAGFVAQQYVAALPEIDVDYRSASPSQGENKAVFTDFEFDFTERLSLLGGFRYDRQSYGFGSQTSAVFAGTLPDPAAFGPTLAPVIAGINQAVLGFVSEANGTSPYSTRTFNTFLPKLGARYAFTDDVSLAFVAQRGYRSGGSSFNVARSMVVPYDPEYTDNYELSLRSQWLGGRLTLNANTYYIDWKDKQVSVNFGQGSFDYHTVNAGRAHLYGFELEATHRVSSGFDWYASLGHSRTQFDQFVPVFGGVIADYSGTEFAYAPRWTLAIGGNWRFGDHWVANLNANHRTEIYSDTGAFQTRLSDRTLVNGRFGYDTDLWSAWVFVDNLFDENYIQYRFTDQTLGLSHGLLGAPRVVGIGFEAHW
ncbi:TonB-dependent receptor [Pseudoxanthomonas japonensis]|uniref:TonB-dependent receptor n=1 Tax=Pseudoxanthomonas japonensis TaxID=69284 RepID=UPI0020C069AA|nr:TonB-dependent receptor [Pseudoxanthomonas japonensis]